LDRRRAISGIAALASLAPRVTYAQQSKVWRVGFLWGGPRPPMGTPPGALREALAQLGYVEGRNLTYVVRWADAKFERLPALAAELAQSDVDVIVLTGWLAASAAKRATSKVPIVVVACGDVAETGLVASLSRTRSNITGVSDPEAELSAKRLQLIKETVPRASRLAVLWNQDDVGMTFRYREIGAAAQTLGVAIQPLGVRAPDDFAEAFTAMQRERPDAIFLVTDALTSLNRRKVIEFAAAHRIPAMYEFASYARDGGLMAYGSSFEEGLSRAAYYVDRILRGAKASELPMEQPTRFHLIINLKTAKELGLTIPQSVLVRADEVIQ
jgi:ABC-type uncharacterized transport system substrate-binding protein